MKISCPHCGQHFDVEEADFGKEADCTNCGKRFILQRSAEQPVPAQQSPVSVACPYCGGEISPGVKKCRHCGEWLNPKNCPRSPVVYVLLGIFGGLFGLHSFYANRSGFGALHCVLTFWGLVALFFGDMFHKDGAVIGGLLLLINCVLIMIGLVKCESCR